MVQDKKLPAEETKEIRLFKLLISLAFLRLFVLVLAMKDTTTTTTTQGPQNNHTQSRSVYAGSDSGSLCAHYCHGPDSDARDVKVVIMNRVCLCLCALRPLRGTTESATVINPSHQWH
ncbi:hypothetical protein VNO77_00018 [Canavalia gladiata]|uniref:Uncharacterized protein n=1 Tax=Canavalia gladiata TaxID=3824 RepID=A0AAN9R3L2_CANGL